MSSLQFQITKEGDAQSATIFLGGETYIVDGSHPKFTEIRDLLFADETEGLLDLIIPAKTVADKLIGLSERVTYKNGQISFDGTIMESALADTIVSIIESGEDNYMPFVHFMERLANNPSKKSRKHLFHFIEANGITLNEDGRILFYKGVRNDHRSIHAGYGVVFPAGSDEAVVYNHDFLPNDVGSVVTIPRDMVDGDREAACSVGLHVGSHRYASSFAQVLLHVLVDPRDVVSVPHDAQNQKVRVSRYTVIEVSAEKVESVYSDYPDEDEDSEDEIFEDGSDEESEVYEDEDEDEDGEPDFPEGSRIPEYMGIIPTLVKDGVSLRRYRSKNVTSGRRSEFSEAAKRLGFDLD